MVGGQCDRRQHCLIAQLCQEKSHTRSNHRIARVLLGSLRFVIAQGVTTQCPTSKTEKCDTSNNADGSSWHPIANN